MEEALVSLTPAVDVPISFLAPVEEAPFSMTPVVDVPVSSLTPDVDVPIFPSTPLNN